MAVITQAIEKMIEPAVIALGYELVGCELSQERGQALLRVFIDSPKGVNIDDCVAASRQINAVLEVEDPIKTKYRLEVSSPGLDRPLYKLDHYKKFIGENVKLRLRQPRDEQRNFTGKLHAVNGEQIVLALDDSELIEFAFADIDKAHLIPDF